jgi:hypothetical protein
MLEENEAAKYTNCPELNLLETGAVSWTLSRLAATGCG